MSVEEPALLNPEPSLRVPSLIERGEPTIAGAETLASDLFLDDNRQQVKEANTDGYSSLPVDLVQK